MMKRIHKDQKRSSKITAMLVWGILFGGAVAGVFAFLKRKKTKPNKACSKGTPCSKEEKTTIDGNASPNATAPLSEMPPLCAESRCNSPEWERTSYEASNSKF